MTDPLDRHLEPHDIAAYVDGLASGEGRAWMDAHLASCPDCRAEVREVTRIVRTAPAVRGMSRWIWIPVAAAAALALLWGRPGMYTPGSEEYREEPVTTAVAPHALVPVGAVDAVGTFIWSAVPEAGAYRVRLFDADGGVLWESEAADTAASLPDSVTLRRGVPYYWRVEAHSGFDRWAASDLAEFRLQRGQ